MRSFLTGRTVLLCNRRDTANLPNPDVLALQKAEELGAALQQFATIAEDLKP